MVVLDASTLTAALIDRGPGGDWARSVVLDGPLDAPHLLPVEVASALRRAEQSSVVSADVASLAHRDLLDLDIRLHGYASLAARVWQLRSAVSSDDAWYVALAETLDAPLATLDRRLVRAPGPDCRFITPPE